MHIHHLALRVRDFEKSQQSQDTKFPQSAAALIVRCCLKTDF